MIKKFREFITAFLLYVSYLLAAVLVIIYVMFWRPYISELKQRETPSGPMPRFNNMDFETIKKVGYVVNGKDSSFDQKTFIKPAGVIRVCALGDSFVFGDEVDEHSDYPSILQKLFLQRGYGNVEVINFGNSYHGLSQTYIIREELAKPMGCDFILLGPQTFFHERDRNFNHTFDATPYYLHSIFVLDDASEDGLKRIDIKGDTYQERFADYYSFFPAWRYLRYDWQPPAIIRAMLPEGKIIPNPFFYFAGNPGYSLPEIWSRMLRLFAKDKSVPVIVLVMEEAIYTYFDAHKVATENLKIVRYPENASFPNRSPNRHQSGFGNRLMAEAYFSQLTESGHDIESLDISSRYSPDEAHACSSVHPSLFSYQEVESIAIENESGAIGRLYRASSSVQETFLEEINFSANTYQAMLAIMPGDSMAQAVFLMLDEVPAVGERVYLKINGVEYPVGNVRPVSSQAGLFAVNMQGVDPGYYDMVFISPEIYPALASQDNTDFSLWLGKTLLYSGGRGKGLYTLEPINGNQYRLVANRDGYTHFDFGRFRGNLDWVIRYKTESGGAGEAVRQIRCPLFSYAIKKQTITPPGVSGSYIGKPVAGFARINRS